MSSSASNSSGASALVVQDVQLPAEARDIHLVHQAILGFELDRALADEKHRHFEKLSSIMREQGIPAGAAVSFDYYQLCQQRVDLARRATDNLFDDYDALITPSAVGEADKGQSFTGSALFNNAWTMLHVPAITLPIATGPRGLPFGIQLVGRRREDWRLLHVAEWTRRRLT